METQPFCSTGNCTWPLFTSIEFCSKCQDISQLLEKNESQTEYHICKNFNGPLAQSCQHFRKNYTYTFPILNSQKATKIIIPHDFGLSESYWRGESIWQPNERSFTIPFSSYERQSVSLFLVIPVLIVQNPAEYELHPQTPYISFIRLSTQNDSSFGDIMAADLCALSFCVQKRNVSVSLNRFSSSIVQTVDGTFTTFEMGDAYFDLLFFIADDLNMTSPLRPETYSSETGNFSHVKKLENHTALGPAVVQQWTRVQGSAVGTPA